MKYKPFGDAARSKARSFEQRPWDNRDAAKEAYKPYVDWLAQLRGWTDQQRQAKLDEVASDAIEAESE
jgi:hypothetical protein